MKQEETKEAECKTAPAEMLNELSGNLTTETIETEAPQTSCASTPRDTESQTSGESEPSAAEESDKSDGSDGSDGAGRSEREKTAAEKELAEMIESAGAEAVLDIIKGNRNMIIDRLIAEAKAEQKRRVMPSGISSAKKATTIFDIAAFA